MKPVIGKIILSDKYTLIPAAAAVLIVVFTVITFASSNALEKNNENLAVQLSEMTSLKEELIYMRDIVRSQEKKIGLTEVSGVVSALEQLLNSLGVDAKVIKPLAKTSVKEYREEDAELEIENIDLNTMVNLLYKIENSPVPMKIKNADIRTTFKDPDKFILKLTASLISK
ncbi:hypothetical protein BMS3Abin10_01151 [bacterium BMS3Abin10]|nr:hypothetical protein BMS3Abin10_01151 [bacterium BMS3Abin10]GBE38102.1 hypothetical protein BMS3Bbin08_00704 [bacterium BMS3Bbin08]HDH49809.1 hypothetical protein [Nitrospirota bacterium]HDK41640.1 hypothetical protein [Nitrospirota bacterium]